MCGGRGATMTSVRLNVSRIWVLAVVACVGCAEPNKYDPTNVDRNDGAGGTKTTGGGGGGGSGGSAGTGVGPVGGQGGQDAPVAGTGGGIDGPEPAGDMGGPTCNAGEPRCSGAVVEVCTVAGTWVMKETCTAVC